MATTFTTTSSTSSNNNEKTTNSSSSSLNDVDNKKNKNFEEKMLVDEETSNNNKKTLVINNVDFQDLVNMKGLHDLHFFCMTTQPVNFFFSKKNADNMINNINNNNNNNNNDNNPFITSNNNAIINSDGNYYRNELKKQKTIHPIVQELSETILLSSKNQKNVDLLVDVERACLMLEGCRVTFCKSGKDRTAMAVTFEQSRQLGLFFNIF
jgi:hypothetical protein